MNNKWLWLTGSTSILFFISTVALVVMYSQVRSDFGEARSELSRKTERIASLEKELAQKEIAAQQAIQELHSQMSSTMERVSQMEARKPELPVTVSFRSALTGSGFVARISNKSGAMLPVLLDVYSPSFNTRKQYHLTISPSLYAEIGHLE